MRGPHRKSAFQISLGIALLAIASTSMIRSDAAYAAGSCDTIGTWFDGKHDASNYQIFGITTQLLVRSASPCYPNYSGNLYSGWAGVAGGGFAQYAQSGFVRTYGSGQPTFARHFAQAVAGSLVSENLTNLSADSNVYWNYYTVYDSNAHNMKMYHDGILLKATNWDPVTHWDWFWTAKYEGEVRDFRDDMPGTFSGKAIFGALGVLTANEFWQGDVNTRLNLVTDNDHATQWGQTGLTTACTYGTWCFGIYTN